MQHLISGGVRSATETLLMPNFLARWKRERDFRPACDQQ
jgi:hypothetical protein